MLSDMRNWTDSWRGYLGAIFIAGSAIEKIIGWGGSIDFILARSEDPGWVGDIAAMMGSYSDAISYGLLLVGIWFVVWNERRRTNAILRNYAADPVERTEQHLMVSRPFVEWANNVVGQSLLQSGLHGRVNELEIKARGSADVIGAIAARFLEADLARLEALRVQYMQALDACHNFLVSLDSSDQTSKARWPDLALRAPRIRNEIGKYLSHYGVEWPSERMQDSQLGLLDYSEIADPEFRASFRALKAQQLADDLHISSVKTAIEAAHGHLMTGARAASENVIQNALKAHA